MSFGADAQEITPQNLTKEEAIQYLLNTARESVGATLKNTRGPAPQLTKYYVDKVFSPQGGEEALGPYYTSTYLDHGGSYVLVTTAEIGYGKAHSSYFGNYDMTEVGMEFIDLNGDRIIDGFYRVWSLERPFTSGKFTSSCNGSVNTNTKLSTYVNIR